MVSRVPVTLSGRRAQAARNDQLILDAARAVFTADPEAPIAAVAEHAGVGISALYRRYRGKDELLQRLALDGLERYIQDVEMAVADAGEPWSAFARFMQRCVDAGTSSLTLRFAGSFTATDELYRLGQRAFELTAQLLTRTAASGALRPGIGVADISLLFELLQAVQVRDPARTTQLRQRYLALLLDALHFRTVAPLPGPAPTWEEMRARYER
jgi:AcrR family transcriptional regulator